MPICFVPALQVDGRCIKRSDGYIARLMALLATFSTSSSLTCHRLFYVTGWVKKINLP